MGVAELHDSCDGDAEINILSVSNQYFSQVKLEELDRGWGSRKITGYAGNGYASIKIFCSIVHVHHKHVLNASLISLLLILQ